MSSARVAIINKSLPQYRKRFFELLRERLATEGIELVLIYGRPSSADASKRDLVDLPWAVRIRNRIFRVGRRELCWQPALPHLKGIDLVIVEQASKLLLNYVLLFQQALRMRRVAFWGHGRNFQVQTASRIGEAVKRFVSRAPNWWFAYNETSARVVSRLGFPSERITLVQNAIDTRFLTQVAEIVSADSLQALRSQLALKGEHVAVYCGGMYKEKRLEFLVEACREIRRQIPDFEVIIIGAGPDQRLVERAAETCEWMHYVGPKFDAEKVPYFRLSKVYLMPGLVGLGVLDSFALETPLVTTRIDYHSPEIEYLIDGYNGMVTPDDVQLYASAVVSLLKSEEYRTQLIAGCREAAALYTVGAMVENFAQGIIQALSEK